MKCFILWCTQHIPKFMNIWHQTYSKGNPLLPLHGLLFLISSKFFFMQHPSDRIAHITAFVKPVVEQEIAQWVHHEGSIWQSIALWANNFTMELYLTAITLDDPWEWYMYQWATVSLFCTFHAKLIYKLQTLSNRAMYREKPNWSFRAILSDSCWQSSRAVVAESASSVFVLPSMNVIGSIRGFFDLVAWIQGNRRKEFQFKF